MVDEKLSGASCSTEALGGNHFDVHNLELVEGAKQENLRAQKPAASPSNTADQGRGELEEGGMWHTRRVLVLFKMFRDCLKIICNIFM